MPDRKPRDLVFTRSDGTQVLITMWTGGDVTLAERDGAGDVWGPPLGPSFDSAQRVTLRDIDTSIAAAVRIIEDNTPPPEGGGRV